MMKATLWLACALAALHLGVSAQERSPLSLSAELRGGAALHALQFSQLPSHPVCCVTFTDTWNWAASLEVGAEYRTGVRLPGGTLSMGLMAGAALMPLAMHQQERGINLVSDQNVFEGVIDHTLRLSYMAITLRPYVAIPVASGLWAMAGMQAGFPASTRVDQQEVLVRPEGYSFENGLRIRNVYSEPLPEATGIVLWADLALRYDLHLSDDVVFSPIVRYQHPLSNITSAVPWSVSTASAGVQVRWNRRVEPPPPPPPPPPAPAPAPAAIPAVAALQSSIVVTSPMPGTVERDGELYIPAIDVRQVDTLNRIYPAIFFAARSNEPVTAFDPVIQAVQQWLADRPEHRLTLAVYTSADEDRAIAKARVDAVLRNLTVDQNKVTIQLKPQSSVPYPELADEQRRVEFLVDGTLQPLTILRRSITETLLPVELSAVHQLTCEAGPCASVAAATADGQDVQVTLQRSVGKLTLHRKVLASGRPVSVEVRITTTDTTGAVTVATQTRSVRVVERSRSVDSILQSGSASELILGYFEFGSSTLHIIDSAVLRTAQRALDQGKRIQLIAGSDGFGTEDVNRQLRARRAQAARALFVSDRIETIQEAARSVAAPPMERIAQRSIRLRILADAD